MSATGNQQEPYTTNSLGGNDVTLVPATAAAPVAGANANIDIRHDYELAERVGTREAWDSFVAAHPSGFYTDLAKAQRNKLAAEAAQIAATEKARAAAQEQARLAAEGAKPASRPRPPRCRAPRRASVWPPKKSGWRPRRRKSSRKPRSPQPLRRQKTSLTPASPPRSRRCRRLPRRPDPVRRSRRTFPGCCNPNCGGSAARPAKSTANGMRPAAGRCRSSRQCRHQIRRKTRQHRCARRGQGQPGRVCPLECDRGFRVDGDRCVKITCDSDQVLGPNGTCRPRPERAPESGRPSRAALFRARRRCFVYNGASSASEKCAGHRGAPLSKACIRLDHARL